MRNSQPLDDVVDCGGNFHQAGSQDPFSSITTFGRLFDAFLPVCSVSSFVGGDCMVVEAKKSADYADKELKKKNVRHGFKMDGCPG